MEVYDSDYYGENGAEAVITQRNKPGSDSSFDYEEPGGTIYIIFQS